MDDYEITIFQKKCFDTPLQLQVNRHSKKYVHVCVQMITKFSVFSRF